MGLSRLLIVYFRYFLDTISIIQIEKSLDGVHGIRTRGCKMVGADKTTELWQPPKYTNIKIVMRLVTADQNALFQHNGSTLFYHLFTNNNGSSFRYFN